MSTGNGTMFWTDARIAELKSRWANHETFSEIAMALGHRSRNAVIGKAHRLGLRRGPDRKPPRNNASQPRLPRQLPVRSNGRQHFLEQTAMTADEDTPPGFAAPKRFIDLGHTDCRWPGAGVVGPDLLCCAAPAYGAYPYCLVHCRMAYTAPGPRPKARRP